MCLYKKNMYLCNPFFKGKTLRYLKYFYDAGVAQLARAADL